MMQGMKLLDLLKMSGSSLWKRKIRTLLTVSGVLIGTSSLVVTVSLGLGLNKATLEDVEQYGSLKTVEVYQKGSGMVYSEEGSSSEETTDEIKMLDDKAVAELSQIEKVESVYPILETYALFKAGAYESNTSIQAMSKEALADQKFEFAQGGLPEEEGALTFVYGNIVLTYFYHSKTGSGYWETGEVPDIDLMEDAMQVIFDTEGYYNSQNPGDSTTVTKPPKKHLIHASGVLKGGPEDYGPQSYYVFCEIESLKRILKKEFKNRAIPNQPTMPSGKPYKDIFYTKLLLNVEDMNDITAVQTKAKELGYDATSNMEWVESIKSQMRIVSLVLGGLGAVALFVASIGIMNTMMMSIYERTKEIGVMKVLGCDMRNIQALFLFEAGYIGFFGGVMGIILSHGISLVINFAVKIFGGESGPSTISYIPIWLTLLAIVFSVLIGMLSGFIPSLRAMKLSPLAAIRNE